jgi:hypothetical protein
VTLTDTGAHRRGFKGVNTHTHEGPSEISTPPRRGCPFHQGTTARCSSSSRQPRDTALTLPPQNSAHTQTAGQGRCHRRRPTKRAQRRLRASARGLTRKTRADGATKSPFHQQHQHHPQHQGDNRLGGGEPLTQIHSLYWAPQQTRLRRWDGEGIARQGDKRVAVGGPKRAHCTAIFCWIHWSRSAGCAWHWSERWPIDPGTEPLPHSMQADMITLCTASLG